MPHKSSIKTSNEPKKNKSSYMFFCIDERNVIKNDETISLNNKEIISELGVRWKKLKETDPDRVKYFENLANEDKIRYENEKKTTLSSVVITSKNEEVNDSEEVKSKIVINGYINFCKKNRIRVKELNKDLLPKEIAKKLTEEWRSLTDDEKQKYKY
jgi:hypothetical protein